jgi:ribosomal protein L11 methyltransferase
MAFGTAEHPTTRSSLRLIDPLVRPRSRIADVGAGSGILSIAAVFFGAAEVVAFESDPLACETARGNLEANGVTDAVRVLEGEVGGEGPLSGSPFGGLVANLQTFIHLPLLDLFRRSVESGGWIVLAGILRAEKDELLSSAEKVGMVLEAEDEEGEWWAGAFSLAPVPESE